MKIKSGLPFGLLAAAVVLGSHAIALEKPNITYQVFQFPALSSTGLPASDCNGSVAAIDIDISISLLMTMCISFAVLHEPELSQMRARTDCAPRSLATHIKNSRRGC